MLIRVLNICFQDRNYNFAAYKFFKIVK